MNNMQIDNDFVENKYGLFIWMSIETFEDFFIDLKTKPMIGNIMHNTNYEYEYQSK
jgi:hypothetical protein